ncbi:membrane protein [Alsobacter metallidurans]|uniref:Membrane protein n=1 Tax=Alsobacter metallidurans TaxID=340221 RepID=A0A917I8H5_9HYPH|nr:PQQ-dependent catabolism-associated beta-propeller protein [Alsobacter metallidurans]GGH25675.1 membrane protein [Alsobacter metallidurans]
MVGGRSAWVRRLVALVVASAVAQGAAAGTGLIYVSHERSDNIVMLNKADEVVGQFKTCARPRGMLRLPDGKSLVVACGNDDTIAVYDLASHTLLKRFRDIPDPETFDLHPNGRDLYISNEDDSEATVLNLETGEVTAHHATGPEPEGVLATPDGKSVFVASEAGNLVHVIDTASGKVVKDIITGSRPRRFALAPGGKELWVSCEISGIVDIIDVETLASKGQINFLPKGMRREQVTPVDLVITRDGKTAYVALGRANHIAVVDVGTRAVKDYILVGRRPWGLRFSTDEKTLYVANGLSDDLSIIDIPSGKVRKTVPVGMVPYAVIVDD